MNISQRLSFLYRAWRYRLKVERAEIAFLRKHLRRGQTALDIGAHKGAFTYWMQGIVGPSGHVVAFEPQPELASYLREMTQAQKYRHVTVVEAALSSRPGTTRLFRPGARPSPSATLEAAHGHDSDTAVNVRVESLDRYFVGSRDRVHFIKCDVEGHELDVFRGGEQLLRRDQPLLLFECEARHHAQNSIGDVFDYLQSLGYSGFFFRKGATVPLAELHDEDQSQPRADGYVYNFAFLPANVAGSRSAAA